MSGQSQGNGFPFAGCATAPGLRHPAYGKVCGRPMCRASPGSAALPSLMTNELTLVGAAGQAAGRGPFQHPSALPQHPRHVVTLVTTRGRVLARASSHFVQLCFECGWGILLFQFQLAFEMYVFILSFYYRELFLIIWSWKTIK